MVVASAFFCLYSIYCKRLWRSFSSLCYPLNDGFLCMGCQLDWILRRLIDTCTHVLFGFGHLSLRERHFISRKNVPLPIPQATRVTRLVIDNRSVDGAHERRRLSDEYIVGEQQNQDVPFFRGNLAWCFSVNIAWKLQPISCSPNH